MLTPTPKEKKILAILKSLAKELKGSNNWIFCDGQMNLMRKNDDGEKAVSVLDRFQERNDPEMVVDSVIMDCDGGAW